MANFPGHERDDVYGTLLKSSLYTLINSVDYITYVFAMAGLKGNNLLVSSSIQYVINVVMTIPALLYVDRWGRRPTLLIGAFLMALWLFINAGLLAGNIALCFLFSGYACLTLSRLWLLRRSQWH